MGVATGPAFWSSIMCWKWKVISCPVHFYVSHWKSTILLVIWQHLSCGKLGVFDHFMSWQGIVQLVKANVIPHLRKKIRHVICICPFYQGIFHHKSKPNKWVIFNWSYTHFFVTNLRPVKGNSGIMVLVIILCHQHWALVLLIS